MEPKELLQKKLRAQKTERELFCPAIYEHKAKLIGKSVSEVACNSDLLKRSLLAEYEIYQPDMLTAGIDIYNIEAEALGAEVVFPDACNAVPSIKENILKDISELNQLTIPDIAQAGRIPILLDVSEKISQQLGSVLPVRGALSGPYSIAAELFGIEPLLMTCISEPEKFCELLDLTTAFAIDYGKEYIKRGLCLCMFDSQASPPLVSPDMFEKFLLPRYQKIALEFKNLGCKLIELVIGGKTNQISKYILNTDFDIVLCDFSSDPNSYFNAQHKHEILIRRNINPLLIEKGDFDQLQNEINEIKELSEIHSNLIIGTGVLSYNAPSENILKVKEMCTG
jgi:uroporphyrinogen decarboxylase